MNIHRNHIWYRKFFKVFALNINKHIKGAVWFGKGFSGTFHLLGNILLRDLAGWLVHGHERPHRVRNILRLRPASLVHGRRICQVVHVHAQRSPDD